MTTISWTDDTWNPTDGCEVCSPGCANCYAMRFAGRFSGPGQRYHGLVTIAKNKRAIWTGEGRLDAGKLAKPLSWRKPRRIFVNSMSDLFFERFTNEEIAAVFGVMAACPQHTFQVLTKRARRMREWFEWIAEQPSESGPRWHGAALTCARRAFDILEWEPRLNREDEYRTWPLPNVWLGVSVENQDAADERIPELLRTPAAIRFLSCEPLLGPLDLDRYLRKMHRRMGDFGVEIVRLPSDVGWLIAGCESGPGARPCEVSWLRSLRDQCAAAGVPYFLKQALGETALCDNPPPDSCRHVVRYRVISEKTAIASCACTIEGGEVCNVPPIAEGDGSRRKWDGNIIELPYLDGVQHAAFPEARS